ncbi:hypothetical protein ACIBKY_03870 [Nonomuraea sp. NPDC050394]|uniref:hypothetical protein n=1 Tax=Nonomuraea sp. NPDC050394 TaxID=3364363 RepID=UPI0037B622FF
MTTEVSETTQDETETTDTDTGIHEFVSAVTVPVTSEQARRIETSRRNFMLHEKTWVVGQDTYCDQCKLRWADAITVPCSGPHTELLQGGNGPTVRRKRKRPAPGTSAEEVALRQRSSLGDLYG